MIPHCNTFAKALVGAREAAAAIQSTNCPLDHLSLWHNLETRVDVAAVRRSNFQAGHQHRHMGGKLGATKASVHMATLQTSGRVQHFVELLLRGGPIRCLLGKHVQPRHTAEALEKDEAPAAIGPFDAVVAGLRVQAWEGDRVAVAHGGGTPTAQFPDPASEGVESGLLRLEDTGGGLRPESAVGHALGRKLLWQDYPLVSMYREVEQGVDDATEAGARPSGLIGQCEERLEAAPLLVDEIGVVGATFHRLGTGRRGGIVELGQGPANEVLQVCGEFARCSPSPSRTPSVYILLTIAKYLAESRFWASQEFEG